MVKGIRSLLSWGSSDGSKPTVTSLFPKVDPAFDGDDCDHDCATCTTSYPKGFKIEESMELYGGIKPWETHLIVATGKADWTREISDEKGSVMEAIGGVKGMKLSASNMPLPGDSTGYDDPTNALLLPAMTTIENVDPGNVQVLIEDYVKPSLKTTTRLKAEAKGEVQNRTAEDTRGPHALAQDFNQMRISNGRPASDPSQGPSPAVPTGLRLRARPCPHSTVILLCSQRTRDVRCGQSAPLIKRELERHLRPLGLYRDWDDERPGGVGIYFISHVGGHKWSANMLVYRRPDPWGVEEKSWARGEVGDLVKQAATKAEGKRKGSSMGPENGDDEDQQSQDDEGAAQCIWLARVKPEDCEGIVKYTVLQGKVVKPEWQLRGGFDRGRGLVSWNHVHTTPESDRIHYNPSSFYTSISSKKITTGSTALLYIFDHNCIASSHLDRDFGLLSPDSIPLWFITLNVVSVGPLGATTERDVESPHETETRNRKNHGLLGPPIAKQSKSAVIRSFIHRRTNSEGGGLPSSFNLPSEIFNPTGTALDTHEMLLSKPLGEIQQNQVGNSLRSPRKSRDDSHPGSKSSGLASSALPLKKNKGINSSGKDSNGFVKPKKIKSATNLAGLLGKPKSSKNLKKTAGVQDDKNKENRTPASDMIEATAHPPPIYAQFCSNAIDSQDNIFDYTGTGKNDALLGGCSRLMPYQHASQAGWDRVDLPRPSFIAAVNSSRASMEQGGRKLVPQEPGISGGSHRPHRGSRPISIAHAPPRTQSKTDLRAQKPNEPYIDPRDVDAQLEAMLDRRNIPETQRYKMRNLTDTIKMEFIRQDWAEAAATSSRQNESESETGPGDTLAEPIKGSKEIKKASKARSALTLTKPRKQGSKDSGPASPTKKGGIGTLGRHFRSKSTESIVSAGERPESSGSSGSGMNAGTGSAAAGLLAKVTGRRENTAIDFVAYLHKTSQPEVVEVGKLHKLRLLLRNETVAWTEDFIRQGGMKEIVGLLCRIMDVEWREEHEDALLHETLLCLKALCTVALGLQYLHEIQSTLFPALLSMVFDPEKKGPSEFTTRSIITSVLFTYIETGPTCHDRVSRANDVLSYLRDSEPAEEERPVPFVLDMRKERPYRVWCKEVVSVTKEVFWIFLHNLNVVQLPGEPKSTGLTRHTPTVTPTPMTLTDLAPGSLTSPYFSTAEEASHAQFMSSHFPKERPPVPAAPYVGGVEWDATNYLASHLDLLNAIVACISTPGERNALRLQLRVSGFERCLGGSLRLCKEKFYGAVHDGLRTWVAAAHADAWDVRDVRYGPPSPEKGRGRSQSPAKKQKRDEVDPPRLDMPKLDFKLESSQSTECGPWSS
ncbi:hypothetical protein MKZ38_008144 [Zalerion maritima]|uniref:Formin GTPase-binding domain-containing protein n=1 Tax=Zalerion maritima TaxID=339359 RepID=A0AAD5RH05_9PEZI|nr:hypothetical protein MKZ38_008144 [Zalerion maritima]